MIHYITVYCIDFLTYFGREYVEIVATTIVLLLYPFNTLHITYFPSLISRPAHVIA